MINRTVYDYLVKSERKFPDKKAFVCGKDFIIYHDLLLDVDYVASEISSYGISKKPIGIFLDRGINCVISMYGVVRSGNFYTVIDSESPDSRLEKIIDTLKPELFITDSHHLEIIKKVTHGSDVLLIEDALKHKYISPVLDATYNKILQSDVMYVLFTSGSTGSPKGIVTPHRSVLNYIPALSQAYNANSDSIIGAQAPFYFVMSLMDVFGTAYVGATAFIMNKGIFTFPSSLAKYIAQNNISFINWVPSALCGISKLDLFERVDLSCLKTIGFGGEVMPIVQLNKWMDALPKARFINGYGQTEVTDGSTYYVVDRKYDSDDKLPIGLPFANSEALVFDDDETLISSPNVPGELYMRSDSLNYGYYNDRKKTELVFIQNPLNKSYRELVYKTGDIVQYNEEGQLVYIGRKDFQIKHMGRRIELGEIEANVNSIQGVSESACIYNYEKKCIVLIYSGLINCDDVKNTLKKLLVDYMLPGEIHQVGQMPHNANGKIDRNKQIGRAHV